MQAGRIEVTLPTCVYGKAGHGGGVCVRVRACVCVRECVFIGLILLNLLTPDS